MVEPRAGQKHPSTAISNRGKEGEGCALRPQRTLDAQTGLPLVHRLKSVLDLAQLAAGAERREGKRVRRVAHGFWGLGGIPAPGQSCLPTMKSVVFSPLRPPARLAIDCAAAASSYSAPISVNCYCEAVPRHRCSPGLRPSCRSKAGNGSAALVSRRAVPRRLNTRASLPLGFFVRVSFCLVLLQSALLLPAVPSRSLPLYLTRVSWRCVALCAWQARPLQPHSCARGVPARHRWCWHIAVRSAVAHRGRGTANAWRLVLCWC